MPALSLEAQTLHAELVERLRAFEQARSFASLAGTFARKEVRGASYWYFKTSASGTGQKEYYVGPDDEATRALIDRYAQGRETARADIEGIERLCGMLRAGGAMLTDVPSARVIHGLASAGVFRLGGTLVGTHAYIAIGNLLGMRWSSSMRTHDIDIAARRVVQIGVPQIEADVPQALEALQMGFLPVPGLDPRDPETSYKVRGQPLRVDLLTPATGARHSGAIRIKRLNAAAQPLEFLDYLLQATVNAAVIDGGASLVAVPDPARFGLHKLAVAERRPPAEQAKAIKDRAQAGELLQFLIGSRPGDIDLALGALRGEPRIWRKRIAQSADRLSPEFTEVAAVLRRRMRETA